MVIAPIWLVQTSNMMCMFAGSPHITPSKISIKGAWSESRDPLKLAWQIYALTKRLLVLSSKQTVGSVFPRIVSILPNNVDRVKELRVIGKCFEYFPRLRIGHHNQNVSMTFSIQR